MKTILSIVPRVPAYKDDEQKAEKLQMAIEEIRKWFEEEE